MIHHQAAFIASHCFKCDAIVDQMSVICLGQNSIQVGIEVEKLALRFNVAHSRILNVDNDIQTENKSIIHLCRCSSHIVFNQSDGCRYCISNVDLLLYHLTSLFSESDCTQPTVVIADLSSAFGVWSLRIVLRYIRHHYPLMSIYCVLRKPSNIRIQGVENYFCVLNFQMALEYCTNVFIRGHNSAFLSQTSSTIEDAPSTVNVDAGLVDSTVPSLTSCDVFVLLMMTTWNNQRTQTVFKLDESSAANSISYCPELSLCCNGQQVIDLRSSCQKIVKLLFHSPKTKSASGASKLSDYNALRSCISSVHHTHQSYSVEYPDYSLWGTGADNLKDNDTVSNSSSSSGKKQTRKMVVYGPNFVNLMIQKTSDTAASKSFCINTRLTSALPCDSISAANLTALNSATPNIKWILDNHRDLSGWKHPENECRDDISVVSGISNVTSSTRATARTSTASISGGGVYAEGIASGGAGRDSASIALCAIVFESIYAKHDIREICRRTKIMINVGAYTHLFDGRSISVQDVVDAITYIDNAIN